MIHIGAIWGAVFANLPKFELMFPNYKFYYRLRDDKSKRDLLSCGAAAGVVAGFLSPLGGFMFAMEEASTFWSYKMTIRTFFISMICGLSIFFLNSIRENDYNIYDLVRFGNYLDDALFSMYEIPLFILLGIICGLIGSLWN